MKKGTLVFEPLHKDIMLPDSMYAKLNALIYRAQESTDLAMSKTNINFLFMKPKNDLLFHCYLV